MKNRQYGRNAEDGRECYTVAILCGGKSRRMGQDKVTMLYEGLPMVVRLCRAFSGAEQILLSVRDDEQEKELTEILRQHNRDLPGPAGTADSGGVLLATGGSPEFSFVSDSVRDAGPIAGITAALEACRAEWLFVAAVDMPEMDAVFAEELLSQMESRRGEVQVILPVEPEGRLHPLAAFYRKAAAPLFAKALAEGRYAVRDVIGGTSVLRIQADHLTDGIRKLVNRNTPE